MVPLLVQAQAQGLVLVLVLVLVPVQELALAVAARGLPLGWVLALARFLELAAAAFPARQFGAICLHRCQLSGAGQAGSRRLPGR